jgi:hypothetical protein
MQGRPRWRAGFGQPPPKDFALHPKHGTRDPRLKQLSAFSKFIDDATSY